MNRKLLKGKLALITGGSGGIGRVVASHFLRNGASVCILGSNPQRLAGALSALRSEVQDQVFGIRCDVGSRAAVQHAVLQATKKLGGLDILVNCAAIQKPIGEFVDNSLRLWERNLQVNLLGSVYCCRAVIPILAKRGGGAIINFSGGGATSSRANFSAYAVAKTAIVRFTEVLAEELHPKKIRINAIAPGAINTGMLQEILAAGPLAGKQEMVTAKKRNEEGGASADRAAELVVFLASRRSYCLSGKLISAVWDPWQSWDKTAIQQIMSDSKYNLRRIS